MTCTLRTATGLFSLTLVCAGGCATMGGGPHGAFNHYSTASPLVCRIANYGKFQDVAWTHLPSISIRYVFMDVPAPDQIDATRKRLADHGLTAMVLRGKADLTQPSGVDELCKQFETCEKLGVGYLFFSAKGAGVAKETLYQRLRQAGVCARKHGVIISLETHPELGTNGDVHLETMKNVNHPNVRVNFDTGNIHFYNKNGNAPAELRKIIDYVATVEIKDQKGGPNVWNFPAFGKGDVDIPGVLRILKQHGYNGPVTMEIEGIKGVEWTQAEPQQIIEDSATYLRSLAKFR